MINRILRKFNFLILKASIGSYKSLKKSKFYDSLNAELLKRTKEELKSFYNFYVTEISRADMAISLELATVLFAICKTTNPKRILDLGSGFSSFVLRRFAETSPSVKVVSVDDDVQWLEKTKDYLSNKVKNTSNILSLSNFIESAEFNFDIILLDLNFVEVRKNYIALAVERCSQGGLIIFDDAHKPDFMLEILEQTKGLPIRLFNISHLTRDQFGRYALLGIKK